MSRNVYNTKQKEMILEYLEHLDKDFDTNDLYEGLNRKVGLTTIYRLLDSLIEENKLEKITENKKVIYRYLGECESENHFYLRCNNCGTLYHLDCDCLENFYQTILCEHNFKIDHRNIVLNGICSKCSPKEDK